jgi:Tol biopolymer transport system component
MDTGKRLLMQMPIAGGAPKQLSDKLIELGVFSPDGKQIAALTEEGTGVNTKVEIAILPAQGGLPVKAFPTVFGISNYFQFSQDGKSLYYPVTAKGVSNMGVQPIGTSSVTPVTNFDDLIIYSYDYDWKNKRLAAARGRNNTDVVMLTQQQAQP